MSSLDDQGVAALAYLPDNILERVSGVETIGGESVLFATSSCLLTQPPTQTAVQISLSSSKNGWQIRNVIPVKNDPLE